jgi:hypothetical protein
MRTMQIAKFFKSSKRFFLKTAKPAKVWFPSVAQKFRRKET